MSRTFRRKNYEHEQGANRYYKWKVAGYYTQVDCIWHEEGWFEYVYREPTEEEYYRDYWALHGESKSANSWTPSREFRKRRMGENRMINKTELSKWFKNVDYDPIFEENPRSHYWDWD